MPKTRALAFSRVLQITTPRGEEAFVTTQILYWRFSGLVLSMMDMVA